MIEKRQSNVMKGVMISYVL